jgi:peptidyl-tRNA hydrolase
VLAIGIKCNSLEVSVLELIGNSGTTGKNGIKSCISNKGLSAFVASYLNVNENYSKTSLGLMAQNAQAVQNI